MDDSCRLCLHHDATFANWPRGRCLNYLIVGYIDDYVSPDPRFQKTGPLLGKEKVYG